MKARYLFTALLFVLAFTQVLAQREVRSHTRAGNKQYNAEQYSDAEISYRRALAVNDKDTTARFNLATALIRQQDQAKLQEADSILTNLITEADQTGNRALAARSLYQKGEIAMMAQQYQPAVNAFKESMKRNPADDDARFNYLVAKKLLEEQQQQQQNQDQNQDKQDQQKQDQQQQQQDQQQQNQQNQDQQQQNQDQQQQQQQQEQQQQQMSADQQQSILEQNEREEKETQQRVMRRQQDKDDEKKKEMEMRRRNGTLKDW